MYPAPPARLLSAANLVFAHVLKLEVLQVLCSGTLLPSVCFCSSPFAMNETDSFLAPVALKIYTRPRRMLWLFLPGSPGWQSIHLTGAISGYISVKESTLQRLGGRLTCTS
ncbi:hypothetical protein ACROYT_G001603 [Oculina patagonica]